MELPRRLRLAVDDALAGTPLVELQRAGDLLSRRYRAETRDGRLHLSDDLFAKAYVAARLPATFAAVSACLAAIAEAYPAFAPRRLLDLGAGPGTALWATVERWPELSDATLLEASSPIRRLGEQLATGGFDFVPGWKEGTFRASLPDIADADLSTLCYVLDELEPNAIPSLIDDLWSRTSGVLLVVEPGTPAGWRRILTVRGQLIAMGAHLVAPCPHAFACPVIAPDWCHFAQRVARSRVHLRTKEAEVPWEDEKFSYVAVSRTPVATPASRVLSPPRTGSGKVQLKLCRPDGRLAEPLVTKREGDTFRRARRVGWGDVI